MIPTPFFSSVTDWYHKIRGASQLARCSLIFYTGRRKRKERKKKRLSYFFFVKCVGWFMNSDAKSSSFSHQRRTRLAIVINAIIPCREFIPALPVPFACVMMQKRPDW